MVFQFAVLAFYHIFFMKFLFPLAFRDLEDMEINEVQCESSGRTVRISYAEKIQQHLK